jgi:hypothetical protein
VAINAGDAVLTFLGDATQLDLAFDQVAASAKTKLDPAAASAKGVGTELDNSGKKGQEAGQKISQAWLNVARATQENQAAQKAVSEAMTLVNKVGTENTTAMSALALAQQRAAASAIALAEATKAATESGVREVSGMRERRESMAAIGELSGVTIPRGLRAWIAEMPILGAAMEAAFSVLAPLLMIQVLAEGVSKIIEWHEAAEKLAEDWQKSNTEFRITSNNIKEQIDEQKQKFIEVTQGPIAAYEFALKHIKGTFDQTVGQISGELDKQGQKFVDRGSWFKQLFFGQDEALAKRAGMDMLEFSKRIQEEMKKAQDLNPGKPLAGMDKGLEEFKTKIGELDKQIVDEHNKINGDDHSFALRGLDSASLERYRTVLQTVQGLLQQFRDKEEQTRKTDDATIKSDELANKTELSIAKFNVEEKFALAALAVRSEIDRVTFAHGKESLNLYLDQLRSAENERYNIEVGGMNKRLAELNKDPARNAQAIITTEGEIRTAEQQHQLALLKIREDGYNKQAEQTIAAMRRIVASTKEGSQERINAETAILTFLKATFGEESNQFLEQQVRVTAAVQAQTELRKNLAREEAHFVQQTAEQKANSELAYYSFLRSTAQISAVQLLKIQQQAAETLYQAKRAALVAELNQLGPQEVAAIQKVNHQLALLDQQYNEQRLLIWAQTNNIIEMQYQALGIKSTMMYMNELKTAKEAYAEIARSGTASYGQLLQAQIKVLQAQIALNAAEGKNVAKDQAALDKLIATYHKWAIAIGQINQLGKLQENVLKGLGVDAELMGGTVQNVALGATAALASMFQAWSQGGVTVAQACEQITAAILQSVAKYAFAKAIEQMALGWAALSPMSPDFGHAGEHFTSAGLWFAAGAAASVVGGAISGLSSGGNGSAGGGSSASGSSHSATNAGSNPPPPPVQSINVQSFATGALVSGRTLAMIGDTVNGGDAREIAAPLDDPQAMKAIGDAIAPHLDGGGQNIHFHIRGLVSPDSLTKLMKQMNRKVQRGQGSLVASNALRTTKRSV